MTWRACLLSLTDALVTLRYTSRVLWHRMTWRMCVSSLACGPESEPIVFVGRGLHSSTSQLNLSRVCHKKNTLHTLKTP